MVNFGSNTIVIVSKLVSSTLQVLGFSSKVFIDLSVLCGVIIHTFSKLLSLASVVDLNISGQSLEFINVLRPVVGFHSQ